VEKIIAEKHMRLDSFLTSHLNIARNQVENFIKVTGVKVNDKLVKKCGYKLKSGDAVLFEIKSETKEKDPEYEVDFDIDVLYEDDSLLVLNKPPFITIHPAPSVKEATLVDWLNKKGYSLSNLSGEHRSGIVHRIDKETSGALVVAKTNPAHSFLSDQLQDKSMGRYYLAIISPPLKDDITIESFIQRNPKNRLKMKSGTNGKYAKTKFIKLLTSTDQKYELIAAKLYTGRTHQIRAHLESISRSIIGDTTYGFKSKKDKIIRVMLHAYIIYFTHPKIGKKLFFKAPIFSDMQNILEKHFNREELDEKISPKYILDRFGSDDFERMQ